MHEPVILDAPARLPGVCICGAAGPVIDTKLELDGYGRVYLCLKTCAAQAAEMIGWLPPETAGELAAETERADLAEAALTKVAGDTTLTVREAAAIFSNGVSTTAYSAMALLAENDERKRAA